MQYTAFSPARETAEGNRPGDTGKNDSPQGVGLRTFKTPTISQEDTSSGGGVQWVEDSGKVGLYMTRSKRRAAEKSLGPRKGGFTSATRSEKREGSSKTEKKCLTHRFRGTDRRKPFSSRKGQCVA